MAPEPQGTQEEDDDYLTMSFDDITSSTKHETLTQKKKRLAREAEEKGRPKSKADIALEERQKRETALNNNSIDTSNRGFKMMAALGYTPGSALGVARPTGGPDDIDKRLLEPVGLEMKEDRGGIGADAEKKRKFREQIETVQNGEKKRKVDETDYRDRQQKEREEKKMEAQVHGAMKVCERLEEEEESSKRNQEPQKEAASSSNVSKPLGVINVLWRGLAKQRALHERDQRMRYDLHQSLSRRPTYDDPEEDEEDQVALGRKNKIEEVDIDLDQEDEELEAFEGLDVSQRLQKLVAFLRQKWNYCFWCKFKYPDMQMDGCPGTSEEDHD